MNETGMYAFALAMKELCKEGKLETVEAVFDALLAENVAEDRPGADNLHKETVCVDYETKVLLIALSEILLRSKSVEEAHKALVRMANVEGIILKPYKEAMAELESGDDD